MVTWLWIPLTAIVSALAARWIYLEYKLRNYHSTEREFTKKVHQLFSSVLSDLRRPLNSLEHVRSIYSSPSGSPSVEYSEILDQCTGHTVQELDKAKLFLDLAGEQYKLTPCKLDLKTLLLEAWDSARSRHPERQVRLELIEGASDASVNVPDKQLLKVLFAQQLNRLLLLSPLKVTISFENKSYSHHQVTFEANGHPTLVTSRMTSSDHAGKFSNLLFGDSDSSLDDRLASALCLALDASVIENATETGERMEIYFNCTDQQNTSARSSIKLQA